MSYLVLARKYRPLTFASVSGQEHVTRTLKNTLKKRRIAHAYIFAGPRGVGKTSIARILARALNCQNPSIDDAEPCGECGPCIEILKGSSLSVREIDGASHNSVDHVRELIENFRSLPAPGYQYKVYIIDEVHMLSVAAFNALLKSLEEPPPNTVFVLATTEAHKIPETVLSRCQRFDFRAVGSVALIDRLVEIAAKEKVTVEKEVLHLIYRLSEGSMRDAQSLFDRVISFCGDTVTLAEATQVLGVVEREVFVRLCETIISRDANAALALVASVFDEGLDPSLFIRELAAFWRTLLLARFGEATSVVGGVEAGMDSVRLRALLEPISNQDLQDLVTLVRTACDSALRSTFPRYALESLVVRLATRESVKDIGALIAWLRSGEAPRRDAPRTEPLQPQISSSARGTVPLREPAGVERRVQESRPAAAPPAASSAVAAPNLQFSWEKLVEHVAEKGAPVLAEQLRRAVPEKFLPGTLSLRVPEFCAKYLKEGTNKDKLASMLQEFTGHTGSWNINFSKAMPGMKTDPQSLVAKEKEARAREDREFEKHPAIQELQRVFPGTKIERIK